ncbi:MAG TPA: HIT family protein [Ramlibacter sp.]|nr:HIT family protein [Ramlibacter sp.]
MSKGAGCPLCDEPGGTVIFQAAKWRLIRVDEPGIAAFYRIVWSEHVAEFSDLAPPDRALCMDAIVRTETCIREFLEPDKMNLATLGNVVPHLHWHVIARFRWDSHFPAPVWAAAQREAPRANLEAIERLRPALEAALAARLATLA